MMNNVDFEASKTGLGNFNMHVSNDLFRHDKVGLEK
jgi:hypothetical protein